MALGTWEDGRLGMAKANAAGVWGYGFTLWRENDQVATAVDAGGIYPALLAQVKAFVQTGESPVPPEQSVEVIAFLDYLKGDPAKKEQLTAQLAARARQDPLYATVVREIQILAAGAGLGASASPFKLLGTVSSVTPGKVVVEPLVDLAVKAGARVQIRRASGLASELQVARGTVQQAGGGRITVLLDAAVKTGQVPAAMDAVYVETGD
jgi:hypothetical protein